MTAATAYRRARGARIAIVCDTCAKALAGPAYLPSRWLDLWRTARRTGWHGTADPAREHTCPTCSASAIR